MSPVAAEILKLRTTRVPHALVAVAALLSAIAAAALVGTGSLGDDADGALSLAQGASFAGILALVLGILVVTNEYRHGTIDSTFLAEPRRVRVLLAKLAAAALAALAMTVAVVVAALLVALPWLAARDESFDVTGDAAGAALRLATVYVLYCLLGVGIGAVLQNQVGAIVAALIWFFVAESVVSLVVGLLQDGAGEPDSVSPYLPGSALQAVIGFVEGDEYLLEPWRASAVAAAYVVGLAVAGALAMTRRDP